MVVKEKIKEQKRVIINEARCHVLLFLLSSKRIFLTNRSYFDFCFNIFLRPMITSEADNWGVAMIVCKDYELHFLQSLAMLTFKTSDEWETEKTGSVLPWTWWTDLIIAFNGFNLALLSYWTTAGSEMQGKSEILHIKNLLKPVKLREKPVIQGSSI